MRSMEARHPRKSRAPDNTGADKKFAVFRFRANALPSWASFLFPNRVGIATNKTEKWNRFYGSPSLTIGRNSYAQGATRYRYKSHCDASIGIARRRGVGEAGQGSEAMGDAAGRRRQYALLEAQSDQRVQRQEAAGGLDLLDRRAAWS